MPENNLNLPKTAFSMKANLPSKEPKILETWDKIKLYERLRKKSVGKNKLQKIIKLRNKLKCQKIT